MKSEDSENASLGFEFRLLNNGDVQIFHHARLASTLPGMVASRFAVDIKIWDEKTAQQKMARLTGNYKRGNEKMPNKRD